MASATLGYNEAGFVQIFGDVSAAVHQFDAVRYVAVACLTFAGMDRFLACRREVQSVWTSRPSITAVLYLMNRVITLAALSMNVYVFTQNPTTTDNDCGWWFACQSWTTIITLFFLHAVLMSRLVRLYPRKLLVLAVSSAGVLGQLLVSCILLTKDLRSVSTVPIPGFWFTGCFPVFTGAHLWYIWISAAVLQGLLACAATVATVRTWRANEDIALLGLCLNHGIFLYIGIALSTLGSAIFWTTAPLPLVMIAPSIAISMYSVLGCRLGLTYHRISQPADSQVELATFLSQADMKVDRAKEFSLNRSPGAKTDLDLEMGTGVKKVHLTPESEGTLILAETDDRMVFRERRPSHAGSVSPCPTLSSREASEEVVRSKSMSMSSAIAAPTMEASSARQDVPVMETSIPEQSPVQENNPSPNLARRGFSEDSPRVLKGGLGLSDGSEDEEDELDLELAQEYDEEGRRRPPRRTHQRRWKSYETPPVSESAVTTISASMVRATSLASLPTRPTDSYFPSPRKHLNPPSAWLASAVASSSRLIPSTTPTLHKSSTPTSPSENAAPVRPSSPPPTRSRLSALLIRHRHDVVVTPPPSVPEEEPSQSARSSTACFPISPVDAESTPPSPVTPSRRRLTPRRFSSRSNAARIRRLLAASSSAPGDGDPSSPSSSSMRKRGESDAATICSASTTWVFDNANARDAPDFCA